jgi:hypothetical protein
VAAAAVEASIAPPSPVCAAIVKEGEVTTEAPASLAALVTPAEAVRSGEDAVVVLDGESAALPSSENHDVVIPLVFEST